MAFVNYKLHMFSFLNITSLGSDLVDDSIDCGFTCLEIPSCFSYNVVAFSDINGKFLCELLPSDKFNNSDNFTGSPFYDHFSIPDKRKSSAIMFRVQRTSVWLFT